MISNWFVLNVLKKNNNKKKLTHVFFGFLWENIHLRFWYFLSKISLGKARSNWYRIQKSLKNADIMPLLTSCYHTSRSKLYSKKYIFLELAHLYLHIFVVCEPKYVFVSASSNRMKLGNKCQNTASCTRMTMFHRIST